MFKADEHEVRLNSLVQFLNVEGVDQSKVSLLIQELRDNYNDVNTKFTDNETQINSFKELNEGLRSANMTLISKLGTSIVDIKAQEQKEQPQSQPQEPTLSLDDIANNFI